ncbi:Zinc finger CCCH domain-containing protein 3 [Linum perenne]
MPDTNTNNSLQTKNNAGSNQSSDNIEEAIRRLKIHDDQEKGGDDSGSYPDRPGEPDCVYYLRNGVCGYGVNCRYNHPQYAAQVTKGSQFKEELPERVGEPDCGYYLKTGTCKYGSTCKYHHPKDRNGAGPVSYNLLGLPMRQDEKSCPYYMRTGACKFGGACKFHHPQPASLEAGVPLAGLSTYGSTGSSLIPTAGLPYVGGLPTWSLPRVPYMPAAAAPRLESPQAFAPLYISPSQGIPPPAQGWNTYVGNLSPMSSPSILGSNLVFNSRNHESASNGQVHLMPALTSNLPQRPDQPECRHFMNTGTCKYGSDCKYHHPKERTPQLVTNAGPAGLPSRPGQALCSNYITYGICKFGTNCRFDHPFTGYPYSYSLTVPPLSVLDPSMVTYPPRISPASLSSEPPLTSNNNNGTRNTKQQYQINAGTNTKKTTTTTTTTTTPPSDEATTDTTADPSPPPHSSSKASSEASHD